MCVSATVLMAASSAVSALGALQQGQYQKSMANYQAAQAEADAQVERDAAEIHADKIRKAARRQAGESRVALAGSGVDVGAGSAVTIDSSIYSDAEEDALTIILNGADAARRGKATAEGYRIKGKQAQTDSYFQAAGSALSGAAKVVDRYGTPKQSKRGD